MSIKLIAIGEVAREINVSIDTLRRWDKSGRFVAIRKSGKRFYREDDVEEFIRKIDIATSDIYKIAQEWVLSAKPTEPEETFYCPNSLVFQSQVIKFEKNLGQIVGLENTFPLISAIVGEIGNNSFDHISHFSAMGSNLHFSHFWLLAPACGSWLKEKCFYPDPPRRRGFWFFYFYCNAISSFCFLQLTIDNRR
ncbi:regulatory protein, MerR [sediment metagenome]|uniref:Regulatory protein, MerR n=1 Tax=sediment metagenome TaxID=749907 RepID=D9PH44_9ZZZZ